jgi:hypothetical protein
MGILCLKQLPSSLRPIEGRTNIETFAAFPAMAIKLGRRTDDKRPSLN